RDVTASNISYLIQYGRIKKHSDNGSLLIDREELKNYYDSMTKEKQWKKVLGDDLNWNLSFTEYKESERTKHVHRLHPYKGKFIPQLVEYFLDSHTDEYKKEVYFKPGDIVLDPFCGSGTTLVQANELGLHAIGIDVSAFNTMISNVKLSEYDLISFKRTMDALTRHLVEFNQVRNIKDFEETLLGELSLFNKKFFPSPEYRREVRNGKINEKEYSQEKEKEFLQIFDRIGDKFGIKLEQKNNDNFLDIWYLPSTRAEIDLMFADIHQIKDIKLKKIAALILSRTVRSCRATTHADLGTLRNPVRTTYYCRKHGKICKPIFSIQGWWKRYVEDTLVRIQQFAKLRTKTYQTCLSGDSRNIDIIDEISRREKNFGGLLQNKKIRGIFSSPPYVGMIDYHEQHAYAYDIFGFERRDELEIGPLFKGKGREARQSYQTGISQVLNNCKAFLQNDYNIFLVANDQYNMYPEIADLSGMKIVNQYKRPVLNRVEKSRSAYSEIIFHLKEK
ncbi:MAG: DNA methyltransferase, partial [Candidatus Stygibacter frigidus]|nr:DNA methyltransferase [Candidatus Stygibacter frigidus]